MYYLIREIIGWFFIGVALWLVQMALGYVANRQVVEAGIVVFICSLFFRYGTQFIRVSTAARICSTTQDEKI